jgi:hypothetical protein
MARSHINDLRSNMQREVLRIADAVDLMSSPP